MQNMPYRLSRAISFLSSLAFYPLWHSILSDIDSLFPINEWDSLLTQFILTLNLLGKSNATPKISAYAYHHGPFDYGRMSIALIGYTIQFHVKPGPQLSWG